LTHILFSARRGTRVRARRKRRHFSVSLLRRNHNDSAEQLTPRRSDSRSFLMLSLFILLLCLLLSPLDAGNIRETIEARERKAALRK
jgi:hypothetical protein